MKLCVNNQSQYSEYITSDKIRSDSSSRCMKFFTWLCHKYRAALQTRVMYLCVKAEIPDSGLVITSKNPIIFFDQDLPSTGETGGLVKFTPCRIVTRSEYVKQFNEA